MKALRALPEAEARAAVDAAAGLDSPESAQAVAALMALDGYAYYPTQLGPFRDIAARFGERPPAGDAGVVRNAALAAELRGAIVGFKQAVYPFAFKDAPWPKPPAALARPVRYDWAFRIDVSPARTMLDLLDRRASADAAYAALDGPVFQALYHHRAQRFYPAALTRSKLATALGLAASDTPLIAYYRFANPVGLVDLNDVVMHQAEYRRVVDTLGAHSAELTATVQEMIGPYIPAGVRFDRTVSVLFADGADGWASGEIGGLDLEYFKDDYPRLIAVLAHETFHIAQQAARGPAADAPDRLNGTAGGVLRQAMESIFREGTATYIALPTHLDEAGRAKAVVDGADLLERLAKQTDVREAQKLRNDGIRGAGPFYHLGAAMARVIVARGGPKALAATLPCGGPCFFDAYFAAAKAQPRETLLLSPDLVRAVNAVR